jgi:rubrerythrin
MPRELPSLTMDSAQYPYLSRFAERSAPVRWSPNAVVGAKVPEAFRTRKELTKARRAGLLREDDLREFFHLWIVEEEEHARVLDFIARENRWTPLENRYHRSLCQRLRRQISPIGLYGARLIPGAVIAILGVGAAAEFVTRTLYRSLAKGVEHQELKRCLFRMAAQEANHMAFFLSAATARPSPNAGQTRLLRTVLIHSWQPVGMDRLGRAAWDSTFARLLEESSFRDELAGMDQMLDRIPIFDGLGLMRRFLESVDTFSGAASRENTAPARIDQWASSKC